MYGGSLLSIPRGALNPNTVFKAKELTSDEVLAFVLAALSQVSVYFRGLAAPPLTRIPRAEMENPKGGRDKLGPTCDGRLLQPVLKQVKFNIFHPQLQY